LVSDPAAFNNHITNEKGPENDIWEKKNPKSVIRDQELVERAQIEFPAGLRC
jgi:hypothetical protein